MTTINVSGVLKICFVLFISGHINLIKSFDEAKINAQVRRNLYAQLMEKMNERVELLSESEPNFIDFLSKPLFVYCGLHLSSNVKNYMRQYGAGNGLPVSFYASLVGFVGASLYLKFAGGRKKTAAFRLDTIEDQIMHLQSQLEAYQSHQAIQGIESTIKYKRNMQARGANREIFELAAFACTAGLAAFYGKTLDAKRARLSTLDKGLDQALTLSVGLAFHILFSIYDDIDRDKMRSLNLLISEELNSYFLKDCVRVADSTIKHLDTIVDRQADTIKKQRSDLENVENFKIPFLNLGHK